MQIRCTTSHSCFIFPAGPGGIDLNTLTIVFASQGDSLIVLSNRYEIQLPKNDPKKDAARAVGQAKGSVHRNSEIELQSNNK